MTLKWKNNSNTDIYELATILFLILVIAGIIGIALGSLNGAVKKSAMYDVQEKACFARGGAFVMARSTGFVCVKELAEVSKNEF